MPRKGPEVVNCRAGTVMFDPNPTVTRLIYRSIEIAVIVDGQLSMLRPRDDLYVMDCIRR